MTEVLSSRSTDEPCGCNLGRIGTEYELSGLDDDLVAFWTGTGEEQYGTRELATEVNRRVLAAALEDAGVAVKDGGVENTYRLLTDDGSPVGRVSRPGTNSNGRASRSTTSNRTSSPTRPSTIT